MARGINKMEKKTLREVFEFFPNAKWITEASETINIWDKTRKPKYGNGFYYGNTKISQIYYNRGFNIDWEGREVKCVSRKEIMG